MRPYEPVTVEQVLAFRQERYESSTALIAKKGHDYNRQQQDGGDTLFNLRVCEQLGIVQTTEQGILTRLSDKLMRLISLTAPGVEPAVTDESVLATVDDVHNYVDYLALIHHRRRNHSEIPNGSQASPEAQKLSERLFARHRPRRAGR